MIVSITEQSDIVSPCVKLCKIDKHSSLCQGCLRTIDEITVWSRANRELKLQIWEKIEERKLSELSNSNSD
ncbi:DUF1289 domain-containing protein [Undibacterium sp.]|uniref:DUF1289 domain-containing protein n=1 Tax=Undibacterium sp. TaxID=1914977 RepID=UPI0037523F78